MGSEVPSAWFQILTLKFKSWANYITFLYPGFLISERTTLITTLQGDLSINWDNNMKLAPVPGK